MQRFIDREYTGKIYEADFLGTVNMPPEFFEAEQKLPRDKKGHYRDDDDIYDLFKKYYPKDPTNPEKELAHELRVEIADMLGLLQAKEGGDFLKFYTTVKIPQIDYKLGVDAFVEYTDPKTKKTHRVTIDLTQNPEKETHKADIIVRDLPAPEFEPEKYAEKIEDIASKIGAKLIRMTS